MEYNSFYFLFRVKRQKNNITRAKQLKNCVRNDLRQLLINFFFLFYQNVNKISKH